MHPTLRTIFGAIISTLFIGSPTMAQDYSAFFLKRQQSDGKGNSITYGICKPRPFDASKKYPMVVALHGMAPATPNTLDKINGSIECNIWSRDDQQAQHPCFVLCPMTPLATWDGTPYHSSNLSWAGRNYAGYGSVPKMADTIAFPARCTKAAIDSLIREFPQINVNRIYISGGSMGGVGAYCMAARWPNLFAAVWPIAGLCDPARACSLKTMPMWTVHGTGDDIVNTTADSLFVKAVVSCGGNPKRTWVAGAGHGPFDHFGQEQYHTWLFAQERSPVVEVRNHSLPEQRQGTRRALKAVYGTMAADGRLFDITGKRISASTNRAKVRGSVRIQMPASVGE